MRWRHPEAVLLHKGRQRFVSLQPANHCRTDQRSGAGFAEQGRDAPSNFVLMDRPLDFDNRLRNPRHDGDCHLVRLNVEWHREALGQFVGGRTRVCSGAETSAFFTCSRTGALDDTGFRGAVTVELASSSAAISFLGRVAATIKPITRPNSMKAPTHVFENFLTQAVPLPRPEAAMIGRAVAFNREHVLARLLPMADSQVDLEPRRSDLLVDLVAESTDKLGYSLLE